MLIAIVFFVAILGLFLGAYWLFVLRVEGESEQVIERRLKPNLKVRVAERISLLKQIAPLSTVPAVEKLLARSASVVRPLERLLERSGLSLTVGQLVLASGFLAMLSFFIVVQLTREPWIGLIAAAAAGSP